MFFKQSSVGEKLYANRFKALLFILFISMIVALFSVFLGNIITDNQIAFWIIVFLMVAFYPQVMKALTKSWDPLSIDFLFICGFTLYSITEPIRVVRGLSIYETEYVVFTMILQILGIVFFYLGFIYIPFGKSKKATIIVTEKHLQITWLVILSGVSMLLVYFIGTGAFSGLSKGEISVMKKSRPWLSSFAFGFKFLSIGLLTLYLIYIKRKTKKKSLRFLLLILLTYFSFSMLIGERGEILMLIFSLVIIYNYRVKKIASFKFFILGTIGYFSFITLNYLKGVPLYMMIPYFLENVQLTWYTDLSGEFQSAARNLFLLVEYVPDKIDYLFGITFLSAIANFIPSSIWPNRPSSAVGWFNETFFPGLREIGSGRGFSLLGEGYANFGIIGVCALFFVLGMISKFLYNKMKYSDSDLWMVAYASFIPILIYCIRADVTNITSQFLKGGVVLFLIIYFVGRKIRFSWD